MTDCISIVTAVYNRADKIGRSIASVNSQTYKNINHVIVDGASTDGTLDVIRANASSNSVIISEPDLGIYDAINKGIKASSGDVIGLLHSDDYFATSTELEKVAHAFQDPELDAFYADVSYFKPEDEEQITRRYRSHLFTPNRLKYGLMPAHTSLYLRRRVFEKYGYYRLDYKIAADYEFVVRIFRDGNLKSFYHPDVIVRMQTGGASTAGWRSKLTINQEVVRACEDNGISTNHALVLAKYPFKILELFSK